jgi:phosphatidylserine decarboxylase
MLAREGIVPVGVAAVGALVVTYAGALVPASLLWLAAAVLAVVFRDRRPERPAEPLGLLAPVDGVVLRADSVEDPWFKRRALRVRLRPRTPGIVVVRSATEGKVTGYWVARAPFDAPEDCRASAASGSPNCYSFGLVTDEGEETVLALSCVRRFSRFKLDVSPGERAGQGARIGFAYFISYVDVLLPADARVRVGQRDRVRAGETVIASLAPH